MSRLGSNILANLLSNVWSTALSLLLTPLFVYFLGVESYGLIGFYVSWVAILGILDVGISGTASREIAWLAARPAEASAIPSVVRSLEVAYWTIILALGAGLMAAVWSVGAGWFDTAGLPPAVVHQALMLMVVSLVIRVPSGLYIAGLMGLQRQVKGSGLLALFGTIRGAGAVAVLWLVQPDIRFFFLWQIVASVLQTAALRSVLVKAVRTEGHPARFSSHVLTSLRGYAGGMAAVTALGLVLTQMDKILLSRLVSLEAFGLYMLAWSVASGLSRVAVPLLQAFGPRFTELVSRGDEPALAGQVRIASQLTSVLLLPPSALLMISSHDVLLAWIGDPAIAAKAAPLLSILTGGTVLSASSYPALSVLYSRKQLRPVIAVSATAVVVLLPMLVLAVNNAGATGAAYCWVVSGLILYVAYQTLGLRGLPGIGGLAAVVRDFVKPALASLAVALIGWSLSTLVHGRIQMAALLGVGLLAGWVATLLVCRDVYKIAVNACRWNSIVTLWSA